MALTGNATLQDVIVAKTVGELGSFLDEVARGTSRYRTVHHLTEQIEHQYAGRFAIELIQNAHDPIAAEPAWGAGERRIELMLEPSEAYGTLLVANDGRPFREHDFQALSNLGQSSKDPNEAIGNKGIGFRSVLEVSKAPEIYSCRLGVPGVFGGYCFRFDPAVLSSFERVIEAIVSGDDDPWWHHDGFKRLVGGIRGEAFRARVHAGLNPRNELHLLSPYSLPIPIVPTDPVILEFARRGFATVVRLPLSDGLAREEVEDTLGELTEREILFLQHVGSLTIRTDASVRTYLRGEESAVGGLDRRTIMIRAKGSDEPPRTFWVWRRTFGAIPDGIPADHPAQADARRLADTVARLPGNWKELKEAPIAIAVEPAAPPSSGVFYIHLPTEQATGVGAHLHAPFYGDMSRKTIDFREPLNRLLLDALADFGHQIVKDDLLGGGVVEGGAILDLTAKSSGGGLDDWWRTALRTRGTFSLPLLHTDQGWRGAAEARLVSVPDGATVLTHERIRMHAAFSALSELLTPRATLAKSLIEEHGGPSVEPTPLERAETLQAIATALQTEGRTDWGGFLTEVMRWIPSAPVVARKRILRDQQGALRAAEPDPGEPRIFFAPVRGERARDIDDVPVSLQSRIAFLSSDLPLLDVGADGRRRRTELANWLLQIVDEYSVETILSRVLTPALPERATTLSPDEQQRCRDVLDFAVRLAQLSEGETSLTPHLRKLRLPCRGGWYEATETIAGSGWTELGEVLDRYLQAVETPDAEAVRERVLLTPDAPVWENSAPFIKARIEVLGIANGLLPIDAPASWPNRFDMSGFTVAPPSEPPPGASHTQWRDYRTYFLGGG